MTQFVVSRDEIVAFAKTWPCSGLRNPSSEIIFEFDSENNLVDMSMDSVQLDNADQAALAAMVGEVRDRNIGQEL